MTRAKGDVNSEERQSRRQETLKLSPLELRIERIKHLDNLRLKLLQFFYNGRSVAENYCDEDIALHVHGLSGENRFCATWRRRDGDGGGCDRKVPVFVRIGKLSEHTRPLASIARLQALESCDVLLADAFEIAASPSSKDLLAVVDRKLRFLFDLSGIEDSEFIDEIVQCRTQVVDGFSDKDAKDRWKRPEGGLYRAENGLFPAAIWQSDTSWLALNENVVTFGLTDRGSSLLAIRQVFPCPCDPLITAIQ